MNGTSVKMKTRLKRHLVPVPWKVRLRRCFFHRYHDMFPFEASLRYRQVLFFSGCNTEKPGKMESQGKIRFKQVYVSTYNIALLLPEPGFFFLFKARFRLREEHL